MSKSSPRAARKGRAAGPEPVQLSWQVVPTGTDEFFAEPDPKRAERAMRAMFGMKKLDIAEFQRAADGDHD